MATINFARREIEAKIVYVGPALSGKTTNVQVLHRLVPRAQRGELHQLSTDGDRTLFFDFIPVELGQIAGFTAHFKLFTVPGQVYYQQTRKAVLQGADGVVFVADSAAGRAQANLDAMIDLEQNLRAHGFDLASIPLVVQLNKRDVDDALPVNVMITELNPFGVPTVESIAASGYGVLDTLYKITEIATKRIRENLSGQKNAVRLQAVQKEERESEQEVVDDYLSRIHKVRPEEEASAERMKAAGRMRPDDVDSFLLEFVDRDDELSLDDGLPSMAPEDHRVARAAAAAPPASPPARTVGAPPVFSEAEPAPAPSPVKKSSRRSEKRAAARAASAPAAEPPIDRPAPQPAEPPIDRPAPQMAEPPAAPVVAVSPATQSVVETGAQSAAPAVAEPAPPVQVATPPRPAAEPARAPDVRIPEAPERPAGPAAPAVEAAPQAVARQAQPPTAPRPAESVARAAQPPVAPRPAESVARATQPPAPPRAAEPAPRAVETGRPAEPAAARPEARPAEPRPDRTAQRLRYPEGPPIEAHVDAHALAGVLLREVLGSTVGADGRATIEIVLEREGVARRHPLRFVESTPETPWGTVTGVGIAALVLGFVGGLLVGWQFL